MRNGRSGELNSAFIKAEKIAGEIGTEKTGAGKTDANGTDKRGNADTHIGGVNDGKEPSAKNIERQKAKFAERRYKAKKKAEIKEQRRYLREERARLKRERKAGGDGSRPAKKGYTAAVVALSLSTLILASALTFTAVMPSESDSALENGYRRSFYNTVEQVNSMDLDLSKTLATKSSGAVQSYLMDIAVNSELAENNIQQLPLTDESKFYTAKIINQVGDYAKYLNKKIINGDGLSREDYENLTELYKANNALKNAMKNAMENMDNGYEFRNMSKDFGGNDLLKEFNGLQELSAEYPELIYDGPFSDGREKDGKGAGTDGSVAAESEKITEDQAVKIFSDLFKEYGVTEVRSNGKVNGYPESYAIEGEIKGFSAYANVTVNGDLLMYSYVGSCNGINYDEKVAEEIAREFLVKAGYGELKAVWTNLDNDLYTFNFAPEVGGAIIYPELVKVRVCAETCMVIGVEGRSYCENHRERSVETPILTKSQAREKVSERISVTAGRLAVVPYGNSAERLCYEFYGEKDGDEFFVYIDAENGRQIEMFKVINSDQGKMLM